MAASLGLWLDSDDIARETFGWQQDVVIDEDRLHYDQDYASLILDYIRRSLEYLAVELVELDKLSSRM